MLQALRKARKDICGRACPRPPFLSKVSEVLTENGGGDGARAFISSPYIRTRLFLLVMVLHNAQSRTRCPESQQSFGTDLMKYFLLIGGKGHCLTLGKQRIPSFTISLVVFLRCSTCQHNQAVSISRCSATRMFLVCLIDLHSTLISPSPGSHRVMLCLVDQSCSVRAVSATQRQKTCQQHVIALPKAKDCDNLLEYLN